MPKRRGGPRPGAGRPYGSGTYGESTTVMRVPEGAEQAVLMAISRYMAGQPTPKLWEEPPEVQQAYQQIMGKRTKQAKK